MLEVQILRFLQEPKSLLTFALNKKRIQKELLLEVYEERCETC